MVKKAMKINIQGTVQGIFFQQYIKDYADKMEIKGFSRTLENGKVEVLAEGENDDLDALLIEIKEGPKHSQIRNVEIEEKKWTGEFKEFKILKF
jgi:acylphosphatase